MLCFVVIATTVAAVAAAGPPLPNARQLDFMAMETTQFMHFNVDTAWTPPPGFLNGTNPTYHNCNKLNTGLSNDTQTEGTWPCLNPKIFNPSELDTEQWMEAAVAMGMKEICLTAKHAGGFTMWPSKHTPYGVHGSTSFRGGKGDILKEFVQSAKKWGIKVCYYNNPMTDGFLTQVARLNEEQYMAAQKGILTELLAPGSPYGPVNRLWFDGVLGDSAGGDFRPGYLGTNYSFFYDEVFELVRKLSPGTLISSQRGDICNNVNALYTNQGPAANGTNSSMCTAYSETGGFFHPNELHGITMQEGPDGNTDAKPTYWFWHPNVGHANASRMFDGIIATVGHGGTLNSNIAPQANGRLKDSVVAVMRQTGKALNDTFKLNNKGKATDIAGPCKIGMAVLDVTAPGGFDYIVAMEDLTRGQRIGNYSIDYRVKGSEAWEVLVPPVMPSPPSPPSALHDRPDGSDPRSQYVGYKRIDRPVVDTAALDIEQIRFNCIRVIASMEAGSDVYLRQLSVHAKIVPWE